MVIKEKCSYSRHGSGIADERFRYDAVDDYFKYEVDGNIICTDTERTYAWDGNIILITPEDDVLHIGKIPQTEGQNVTRAWLDEDENLHVKYREYADCDHHHAVMEEMVVDTHLTPERKALIEENRVRLFISRNVSPSENRNYNIAIRFYAGDNPGDIDIGISIKRRASRYTWGDETVYITLRPDESGKYGIIRDDSHDRLKDSYLLMYNGFCYNGIEPLQKALDGYYSEKEKNRDVGEEVL